MRQEMQASTRVRARRLIVAILCVPLVASACEDAPARRVQPPS
jgi:hypothetical protein